MADLITFQKKHPPASPVADPNVIHREGFTITITVGPFIIGDVAPDWADVARQLAVTMQAQWHQEQGAVEERERS